MADKKLTDLASTAAAVDIVLIVDVSSNTTKRSTVGGLATALAASLPAGSVASSAITESAWSAWTPTWTNFTVGNAVVTARYTQVGKTVKGFIRVILGTTTAMGSTPTFTLPVPAASYFSTGNNQIAAGYAEDVGVFGYNILLFLDSSTTVCTLRTAAASSNYVANSVNLTASVPFSWGSTDYFNAAFEYEAA